MYFLVKDTSGNIDKCLLYITLSYCTNSMFYFFRGKARVPDLLYLLLYPNCITLIFNKQSDFDFFHEIKTDINSVKSYAISILSI